MNIPIVDKLLRTKDSQLSVPNFSIKDSQEQTPLAVALWAGLHSIARQLLTGGANINLANSQGLTLLHQAILRQDGPSCVFLLDNQADIHSRYQCNVIKYSET